MSSPASQDTLTITAPVPQGCEHILTEQAKAFVAELGRRFGPRRSELLENRKRRMGRLIAGELPDFLSETASVRAGDWRISPVPE